jgi:molybdopterin synthase sulfur carrier subunit
MPRVVIPPMLRPLTGGQAEVAVEAKTVGGAVAELERLFPGVRERLCDGDELRPEITVAVGGRITSRGLLEPLAESDEVHFLPAIGGG